MLRRPVARTDSAFLYQRSDFQTVIVAVLHHTALQLLQGVQAVEQRIDHLGRHGEPVIANIVEEALHGVVSSAMGVKPTIAEEPLSCGLL